MVGFDDVDESGTESSVFKDDNGDDVDDVVIEEDEEEEDDNDDNVDVESGLELSVDAECGCCIVVEEDNVEVAVGVAEETSF
jgi:hypothetical protein